MFSENTHKQFIMSKKYFAKYIPIEGDLESQIWQWYNNIQNTGWEIISCSDMDAIIAHGLEPSPQFRRVKLFLCSRDIYVGDEVTVTHEDKSMEEIIPTDKTIDFVKKYGGFKVIGEISPDCNIKERQEFDES